MIESVVLKLLPFLADHFPKVVAWAVGAVIRGVVGERAKSILRTRREQKAFASAISRATTQFLRSHRPLADSLFDEYFLRKTVSSEIEAFLTRDRLPDRNAIVVAYGKRFQVAPSVDLVPAIEELILAIESELKKEKELQDLLSHRQVDEVTRILRKLDRANSADGTIGGQLTDNAVIGSRPVFDDALIVDKLTLASEELAAWPQTLDGGVWLERPELTALVSKIEGSELSATLLLGVPGAGKTALLARLASECQRRRWPVLAIRADQLPETLSSLDELATHFDLPAPIVECATQLARSNKVVMLIDQLDALSELIDLRTQRLSILLRLVQELSDRPNIHLVLSCRQFERAYDKRLSGLTADEIQLDLPAWEVVRELLLTKGINAGTWPETFRDVLRVPQFLKLFLRHFAGGGEAHIFQTYLAMLEAIWEERLFRAPESKGAGELIYDIAEDMAEREVLYVPLAKFDSRREQLAYAVSAGLLHLDRQKHQISFTHQTIFDFARARAFVAKEKSLSRYVIDRQTGLFVRPKLWSALSYLRSTDPEAYQREVQAIWREESLRRHLRILLVDFVGQHEEPLRIELEVVRDACSGQNMTAVVLAATSGRPAWFEVLSPAVVPTVMAGKAGDAISAIGFLSAAWKFARNRIIELLKAHWVEDQEKRRFAWHTLVGLQEWDRTTTDLAISLIEGCELDNFSVQHLSSIASVSAPDLAPELVAAQLKKRIDVASKTHSSVEEVPPDATDREVIAAYLRRTSSDVLRAIVTNHSDWYEISAIAEAAPRAYLEKVWPPIRSVIEAYARESEPIHMVYRQDHLSVMALDEDRGAERRLEHPLMDSFVAAACACVKGDVVGFRKFVVENEQSEAMTVHRIIARGLAELAPVDPAFVLEYLLRDERRFSLEGYGEEERDTKLVLSALGSHLDRESLERLERAILALTVYRGGAVEKEPAERLRLSKLNRLVRVRLLAQLPRERLGKQTRELIDSEAKLLPGYGDGSAGGITLWTASSPMSAAQMGKAGDDTVAQFVKAFPDSTEGGDVFSRRGGSVEVSRAFAEFAKKEPQRAVPIIRTLDPGTHQRPAAYAIGALADSTIVDADLFALVEQLDRRGFRGKEFRHEAANALRKRVKRPGGLPDSIIEILEIWLRECDLKDEREDADGESDKQERQQSTLWGHRSFRVLPGGSYTLLDAYFFGLLARGQVTSTATSARVLDGLRAHLARNDHIGVWSAFADFALQHFVALERGNAERFVTELFSAYPKLLRSRSGALAVARMLGWAKPELTQEWMTSLVIDGSRELRQAYGEVLVLRTVILKGDRWSNEESRQWLERERAQVEGSNEVALGLTYAATHLWNDTEQKELLREVLCSAMLSRHPAIAQAAIDWFRLLNSLKWDPSTEPVLRAMLRGGAIAKGGDNTYVLDRIGDLIDEAPEIVYAICQKVVEVNRDQLGNVASVAALEAETLLSIALTLQRQPEPSRTHGLELFEQLLESNAYRVREVLMDIDRRPGASAPATALRRRRRRPKAGAKA